MIELVDAGTPSGRLSEEVSFVESSSGNLCIALAPEHLRDRVWVSCGVRLRGEPKRSENAGSGGV